MATSNSMQGKDTERKLASDHGRGKKKSGGEPKKQREVPHGTGRRSGSRKQRIKAGQPEREVRLTALQGTRLG